MQKTLASLLRQKGYKLTPQRRAVINAIAKSHDHITPAELYERAHSEHSSVGLVTVYRTLKMLSGMGLICEMHNEGHSRSYLLRRPAEHHHHIVCSQCGVVIDFISCELGKLEQRLSEDTGFVMEDHLLEFHGRCPHCQKTAA